MNQAPAHLTHATLPSDDFDPSLSTSVGMRVSSTSRINPRRGSGWVTRNRLTHTYRSQEGFHIIKHGQQSSNMVNKAATHNVVGLGGVGDSMCVERERMGGQDLDAAQAGSHATDSPTPTRGASEGGSGWRGVGGSHTHVATWQQHVSHPVGGMTAQRQHGEVWPQCSQSKFHKLLPRPCAEPTPTLVPPVQSSWHFHWCLALCMTGGGQWPGTPTSCSGSSSNSSTTTSLNVRELRSTNPTMLCRQHPVSQQTVYFSSTLYSETPI
jgi:hypothetical protein